MCRCELRRHNGVIVGNIRVRACGAVLKLRIHPAVRLSGRTALSPGRYPQIGRPPEPASSVNPSGVLLTSRMSGNSGSFTNLGRISAFRVAWIAEAVLEFCVDRDAVSVYRSVGGSGSAPVGNVPALICGPSLTHHVIVAGQERGIALLGGDDPRPSCRGLHLLFNLLGDGGPAVSVLQSSGDDTGDGLLGRINDTGHTLTAPAASPC